MVHLHDPDMLETASEILLAPGGLTRAEGVALRDAVLSDQCHRNIGPSTNRILAP